MITRIAIRRKSVPIMGLPKLRAPRPQTDVTMTREAA